MLEKVTVIDERPDGVRIAKIEAQFDAGVGETTTAVIRHVDRVAQERLVHWDAGPIDHHEMYLMNMKGVQLGGAVLDDPILNFTLFHDDIGNSGGGIKGSGSLTINRDEKRGGAIGIIGIQQFFGEVETAGACWSDAAEPGKS